MILSTSRVSGRDTSTKWNVTRFHYQKLWLVSCSAKKRHGKFLHSENRDEARQAWKFTFFSHIFIVTSFHPESMSEHLERHVITVTSSRLQDYEPRIHVFNFLSLGLRMERSTVSQIHYMQHADNVTITDSFIVKLSMFFGSEILSHLRLTFLWHMHNSTPTRPSVYLRNVHEFPSETIRQVSTRWALKI